MHIKFSVMLAVTVGNAAIWAASLSAAPPRSELDIRSPDGRVLIASDQIRSYEWDTHTLMLVPKTREALADKLRSDRIVAGVPFAVALGGKVVYKGTFTTCLSSYSFSTPVIVIDAVGEEWNLGEDQIRIQTGYPTATFYKGVDLRPDRRIQAALKAGGKLTERKAEDEHTRWIVASLREMETLKPGMTRAQLLKVFQEEGGLSNRTTQRFAYRECPYIKVDAKFQAVGAVDDNLRQSPGDKIVQLSKPFLEWAIAD